MTMIPASASARANARFRRSIVFCCSEIIIRVFTTGRSIIMRVKVSAGNITCIL